MQKKRLSDRVIVLESGERPVIILAEYPFASGAFETEMRYFPPKGQVPPQTPAMTLMQMPETPAITTRYIGQLTCRYQRRPPRPIIFPDSLDISRGDGELYTLAIA
ncbi:hypothetical protein HGP17_21455 [Rhizobium sp. P38BS-XIX]|uniref:hypothetical protein n=1 Tax=Rhizobium sp. P38BS-XIX TaxID=2726740 RepID=UPI00145696D3|nr:hypothetical protein [Rhizobium sp. P38BS-XIX]NLR99397.1 hypothetical protein [Rhizobium sp. P38BS-XIX]